MEKEMGWGVEAMLSLLMGLLPGGRGEGKKKKKRCDPLKPHLLLLFEKFPHL